MKVTQQDVLDTAELLNIDVSAEEVDTLTQSFATLIDYFDVLNKVEIDAEIQDNTDDICRIRDDEMEVRSETEDLVSKSEEYEDNYVVIPNVL